VEKKLREKYRAETLTPMDAAEPAVISVNFTTRAEIEQIDPNTAADAYVNHLRLRK
jgi:hypothetical protein